MKNIDKSNDLNNNESFDSNSLYEVNKTLIFPDVNLRESTSVLDVEQKLIKDN